MMRSLHTVICVIVGIAVSVALIPRATAADFNVFGEAGPEYDSNARRASQDEDVTGSPLIRLSGDASVGFRIAEDHAFQVNYGAGGKVFFRETSANEFVQRAGLNWTYRWDTLHLGSAMLSTFGQYYDSFQRVSERDFRQGWGGVMINLNHSPSGWQGSLQGEYRALQFKPDGNFDFHGPRFILGFTKRLSGAANSFAPQWRAGLSYAAALRFYSGDAIAPPPTSIALADSRCDFDQLPYLHFDYVGEILASLWYGVDINDSNSYGESFTRHLFGVNFTAPFFWDITFTAKGVIQLSQFWDNLFGQLPDQTLTDIDTENRSSLVVYLARDITEWWTLAFRYSMYVAETSSTADGQRVPGFLRHTVFLGARFRWASED